MTTIAKPVAVRPPSPTVEASLSYVAGGAAVPQDQPGAGLAMAPIDVTYLATEPPKLVVDYTDAELVRAYQTTGDEGAFGTIVRRYRDRVVQVLVGLLGCQPLADEIAQRAFVKAAFRMHQLREPEALYAWLLRIARTTALDELKRPERTRRSQADVYDSFERATVPNHALRHLVRRVLAELSVDDREVLLLADMERRSTSEMAAYLGASASAVKMRVKRARERFRRLHARHSRLPDEVAPALC